MFLKWLWHILFAQEHHIAIQRLLGNLKVISGTPTWWCLSRDMPLSWCRLVGRFLGALVEFRPRRWVIFTFAFLRPSSGITYLARIRMMLYHVIQAYHNVAVWCFWRPSKRSPASKKYCWQIDNVSTHSFINFYQNDFHKGCGHPK